MANWQWNKMVKGRQTRTLIVAGSCLLLVLAMMIVLLVDSRPQKTSSLKKSVDLTGIVDESFTEAASDNALAAQQTELESLKKQISELTHTMKTMGDEHKKQLQAQKEEITSQLTSLALANQQKTNTPENQNNSPKSLSEKYHSTE
jgi:conjugal transfer pilus assembly protein TraB